MLRALLTGDRALIPLRNDEGLPDRLAGTDLDLTIGAAQTLDGMTHRVGEIGRGLGWTPVFVNRRSYMVAMPLLGPDGESAVHLDIFDGIGVWGCRLIEPGLLEQEARSGEVRSLSNRAVVLVTLVHHLCWNGGFTNPEYFSRLKTALASDRPWLEGELSRIFGRAFADQICNAPEDLATGRAGRRSRALVNVLGRGLLRRPLATLRGLARYAGDHVRTLVRPTGLVAGPRAVVPGTDHLLTLEVACRLEPHSFAVPHVQAAGSELRSANGERYEESLRSRWAKSARLRRLAPSLYLWFQAKRGEVIMLERLPRLLVLLAKVTKARWISV